MKRNEEPAIFQFAYIILIFALMFLRAVAFGQGYIKKGKQFSVNTEKMADKNTGYTFKDRQGKVYAIYQNRKGGCYVVKRSKKTGKEYRQYLPKEISAEIAKEQGIMGKSL